MSATLVLFRYDLRLSDNPALFAVAEKNQPVIPLFVYDETIKEHIGAASKWWLHQSLKNLSEELENKYKSNLIIRQGNLESALQNLIQKHNVKSIHWNRCYEPHIIKRDKKLKQKLQDEGIEVHSHNGRLLKDPWEVFNQSNQPYRVFTPFWKALRDLPMRPVLPAPKNLKTVEGIPSDSLKSLALLPKIEWDKGFYKTWDVSEKGAQDRLKNFLQNAVTTYKTKRNNPAESATSMLSPYLAWGAISPIQIWHTAEEFRAQNPHAAEGINTFLSELSWREFSYNLLYYNPELASVPLQEKFKNFPWRDEQNYQADLKQWQRGETGYPIVDAGMRELWHTGYMHNRVRMIVASFLIKDLLIPWQEGEKWFWDCLVDADRANNAASWQWVAGCGADAAPYFRVFNPTTQGEKFDPSSTYIRRWVPELGTKNYPKPMVDHAKARQYALEAYQKLKSAS